MMGELTKAILSAVVALTISAPATQLMVLPESADGDEWRRYTVDFEGDVGQYNSIALDSKGYPHISYEDSSHRSLKYARWDGSAWQNETVDPDSYTPRSSIDLDSNDYPHIAYSVDDLKYASWNGTAWRIETLELSIVIGQTSIVLDDADYPHIAYWHDQRELRHTYWDGRNWVIEVVDPLGEQATCVSLALDSHGYPHMSYYARSLLHYAKWNGSAWNIKVPDSVSLVYGQSCSMALDSNDFPHISYHDRSRESLRYAKWNVTAWHTEEISWGGVGVYSSIALDKDDVPHISYRGRRSTNYAVWDGTMWKKETVDVLSIGNSLTLDRCGNPHISYEDYWNKDLKYATRGECAQLRSLSLDIDPDTLNLWSQGRWITAYLRTWNAKAEDIEASSLLLSDVIAPEWWDIQNETTLMVKFNRAAVQAILRVSDSVDIKVDGHWKDGEAFEAHDTIRVIDPGEYREIFRSFYSRERPPSYFIDEYNVFPPIGKLLGGLGLQFQSPRGNHYNHR
jgi:hypothetical protein